MVAFFFEAGNNLLHESSLDYILTAIEFPIFQRDLYPSLFDKAAALFWFIIKKHIFNDGNKRTGLLSAILFLEENGYDFRLDHEAIDIALLIENGNISFEELVSWIESKSFRTQEF